jgi:hypothetical protein
MTKHPSADSGAKQVDARVARRRQDALGRRLRQMYDNVVGEPVPADFLALLEQADDQKKTLDGAAEGNGRDTQPERVAAHGKTGPGK